MINTGTRFSLQMAPLPTSQHRITLLLLLMISMLLPACSRQRESPEEQIRSLIRNAVIAAEQKDLGAMRNLVSDQYADDQGQNKRAVEGLLRVHFLRNESVHLLTRIESVTLPQPDRGRAAVLVAMAGVPITSEAALPGLRADLHRFEIDVVREDKVWRVQRATWYRAELADFISP
jgi:hypothetical protein